MTDREKEIIRLALTFLLVNIDEVPEMFCTENDTIDFNGESMVIPSEQEIDNLLSTL